MSVRGVLTLATLSRRRRSILSLMQKRNYGVPPGFHEDAHMNELPCPHGPWDIWNSDRQQFYTKFLVLGFAWWAFSFGMAMYTGSLYLNWSPPGKPAPPTIIDEEDDTSLPNIGLPPC